MCQDSKISFCNKSKDRFAFASTSDSNEWRSLYVQVKERCHILREWCSAALLAASRVFGPGVASNALGILIISISR